MARPPSALPALLLALAACAPLPPVPGGGTGDDCGASGLRPLLGRPVSVLAAMLLPAPVRIIRPGEAVTMDFVATRLNIELDAGDRIARLYCG